MVYQATSNVIDVKVCSISFQRHCNSLLTQQKNQRNLNGRRSNPRATMAAENQTTKQQQLPVVELRPFVKKVWRREKSLPDFYERKVPEDISGGGGGNSKGSSLDVSPSTSRLVRELTDTRKSLETRQNTMESSVGKYRSHPKAEFSHESTKTWRKQDLIPGFITRLERTRTSTDFPSKENSSLEQRLAMNNDVVWDNLDTPGANFPGFKVKGGKMSQHIHRRHFLYLNPLESYRQPNQWSRQFNSTDNSRHGTGRSHLAPSRDSFPLSSSRARELLWAGSHFNHPLKPIQREDMESPHKFNNKLGAAKSSLQILNKMGAPTKLEKALEKEYEMNLERFRRDRLFLPHDLRNLSNGYVHFDSNPTIGETFLRNAREANKPKKRVQQGNEKLLGLVGQDSNGWYTSDVPVPGIQCVDTHLVNQSVHLINTTLHEEAENRLAVESGVRGHKSEMSSDCVYNAERQKVPTTQPGNNVLERLQSAPVVNSDATLGSDRTTGRPCDSDSNFNASSIGSLNTCQNNVGSSNVGSSLAQNEPTVSSKISDNNVDTDDNNNNHNNNSSNNTPSTNLNSPVDSSRLETNIDYLNNLQRKSKSPFFHQPTPSPGLTNGAIGSTSSESAIKTGPKAATSMGDNPAAATSANDAANVQDQMPPISSLANPADTVDPIAGLNNGGISLGGEVNQEATKGAPHPSDNSNVDAVHATPTSVTEIPTTSLERMDAASSDAQKSQRKNSHDVELDGSEKPKIASLSFGVIPVTDQGRSSTEAKPLGAFREGNNTSHKANSVVRSSATMASLDQKRMQMEENHSSSSRADNCLSNGVKSADTKAGQGPQIDRKEEQYKQSHADRGHSLETETVTFQNHSEITSDQSRGLVLDDEGISMTTPVEAAVLDSSMTEAYSEPDGVMSGCADNGDSGVSTTFITADESRAKEIALGELMVYD